MPVSPARAAAFDILLRIERQSSYASELLHSSAHANLSSTDHALTTELVMGVLRWRSRLDDEISTASSQSLTKLDSEVLVTLRLALYQIRWLDRIPQRAAVHESVELVKRARKGSAAPFVNAVLRKLTTKLAGDEANKHRDSPQSLSRAYAHPLWLVERWTDAYGLTIAKQICARNQTIPNTVVRLRTANAEAELAASGITLHAGAILSSARKIESGDITHTELFRRGEILIQDEASQLVSTLVGRGKRILDCCAAPGGKTLVIADQNLDATLVAIELHPHRARLLSKLLQRSKPDARVHVVAADAQRLPFDISFDRVLADVPCSGTGTLARNPEIKWRLTPNDLPALQSRQKAILRSALARLGTGGRLVYSTCSLEKEENEDVVRQVLADEAAFHLLDCHVELDRLKAAGQLSWPDPASLAAGPFLRTIPGVHPCDGFFAAMVEKK